MNADTKGTLEHLLHTTITHVTPLSGGQIAAVYRVTFAQPLPDTLTPTQTDTQTDTQDVTQAVVKVDLEGDLACEGRMLQYLHDHSRLPVPQVYAQHEGLLVLEHLPGGGLVNADAERHAAELLADLHNVTADAYGFAEDTLIGSLSLPNGWHDDWGQFFAQKRLVHFAALAHERGHLPEKTLARVKQLAEGVPQWCEPNPPGLVHGDVWSGNILAEGDTITGIIDPALYYADPEVDLAYIDLFSTFGDAFWQRYHQVRPIADAFWDYRRALYSLYPLLVHVYYFGTGYLAGVEQRLGWLEQRFH